MRKQGTKWERRGRNGKKGKGTGRERRREKGRGRQEREEGGERGRKEQGQMLTIHACYPAFV